MAVLGADSLDLTQIDPSTLSFEGLDIRVRGNGLPSCSIKDVNRDGYSDLLCQYQDATTVGIHTGKLLDGTRIDGLDTICVIH